MPKFKSGDRVRCVDADAPIMVGMTGAVLEEDVNPHVDWDDFSGGDFAMPNLTGHNRKSVWAVDQDCLELIQDAIDLTAITTPFGLLDAETQKALEQCGGPYIYFDHTGQWTRWTNRHPFNVHVVYRKEKPGPVREAVQKDAHASEWGDVFIVNAPVTMTRPNATVTYETVDGIVDWSTYKVTKRDI